MEHFLHNFENNHHQYKTRLQENLFYHLRIEYGFLRTLKISTKFQFLCTIFIPSFIGFAFQSSSRFPAKLNRKSRCFPHVPYPHILLASPTTKALHQSGTFVKISDPTPTHHHHPKSTVYTRIPSVFLHFMSWHKCITTYIHHFGLLKSTFTTFKILCTPQTGFFPPT